MMNSKETLKKLHKKFPQLSLDDLFDILDCYVEEYYNFFNNQFYDYKNNKLLNTYERTNTNADFDFR